MVVEMPDFSAGCREFLPAQRTLQTPGKTRISGKIGGSTHGRAAARDFSPAGAARHQKFGIRVGGFPSQL